MRAEIETVALALVKILDYESIEFVLGKGFVDPIVNRVITHGNYPLVAYVDSQHHSNGRVEPGRNGSSAIHDTRLLQN
jgi:hypothetical protein